MPLNAKNEAVMRVKVWDDLGVTQSGEKIKKSRIVFVPVENMGWSKEITIDLPTFNDKKGVFEAHKYHFRADAFRCAICKTAQHVYLRLLGWFFPELPVRGTGVYSRCFKHDITSGPADPDEYAEELEVRMVTREEAYKLIEQLGLQPTFTPR